MSLVRTVPSVALLPVVAALAAGCGDGAREGRMAPGFQLADQNGVVRKLEEFRGKAVLVGFWAPWAGPCRLSMAQWGYVQRRHARRGLVVVAVTVFDDAGLAGRVLKDSGSSFPLLAGDESVLKAWLGKGEIKLPAVFILDGQGRVVRRMDGYQRAADLEPVVQEVLATLPSSGERAAKR